MSHFNKQERIWTAALDRAKLLATIMTGLSPFLYWWRQLPNLSFYSQVVLILAFSSLLFLLSINQVLQRLTAMLPDEGLRQEIRMFSSLNIYLVLIVILLLGLFLLILNLRPQSSLLFPLLALLDHISLWFLVFTVLLPVAITMALVWKIKEVILTSIFVTSILNRVPACATTFSSIIMLPKSFAPNFSATWPMAGPCVTHELCTLAKLSR